MWNMPEGVPESLFIILKKAERYHGLEMMSSFADDINPKIAGGSVRWILRQN